MPRPKKRETLLAEAAIKRVIAEETEAIRVELRQAQDKIASLRLMLGQIMEIAGRGVVEHQKLERKPLPEISPKIPENDFPAGPVADLADDDNMGEGRWA